MNTKEINIAAIETCRTYHPKHLCSFCKKGIDYFIYSENSDAFFAIPSDVIRFSCKCESTCEMLSLYWILNPHIYCHGCKKRDCEYIDNNELGKCYFNLLLRLLWQYFETQKAEDGFDQVVKCPFFETSKLYNIVKNVDE